MYKSACPFTGSSRNVVEHLAALEENPPQSLWTKTQLVRYKTYLSVLNTKKNTAMV